ncbi:MAG: hypothetical protein ABR576_01925 [Thermoanaerobaculia bacterium]
MALQNCFLCRGADARVGPAMHRGGAPDSEKRFAVLCAICGGYKIEQRMMVPGAIPEEVGRKLSRIAREQPDASDLLFVTSVIVRSLA